MKTRQCKNLHYKTLHNILKYVMFWFYNRADESEVMIWNGIEL